MLQGPARYQITSSTTDEASTVHMMSTVMQEFPQKHLCCHEHTQSTVDSHRNLPSPDHHSTNFDTKSTAQLRSKKQLLPKLQANRMGNRKEVCCHLHPQALTICLPRCTCVLYAAAAARQLYLSHVFPYASCRCRYPTCKQQHSLPRVLQNPQSTSVSSTHTVTV